ncbi:MAG: inorganic diphosphatase [Candidatus Melainabacteria bacterium]|nr:MAG: inorganic diphosphatase [Candidatus Melainabacteria bacterium]
MKKTRKQASRSKNAKVAASAALKGNLLKVALSKGIIDEKTGLVRAIIENPKGSRNKYKYVPALDLFECGPVLHAGLTWPFDFGFVPSTLAGDGDPLDIVVLMDEPAFPGCLVQVKILGVLEAAQLQDGKTVRNDRVIGVHNHSVRFDELTNWKDIPASIRNEYELFFNVNAMCKGRVFELLGWRDSSVAFKVIESAVKATGKN